MSRARRTGIVALNTALLLPAVAAAQSKLPAVVRGARTVHLWPPASGALTVTVLKRDLNIYAGADTMAVSLLDPTRRQIGAATLPDDGHTGKAPLSHPAGFRRKPRTGAPAGTKVLSKTFKVSAAVPGAYKLRVGACPSSDCVFGLQTSASGLVVEGEVMLNDAKVGGKVYFAPPSGAFAARAMALHKPGCQTVWLRDAKAKAVASLALCDAAGKGVATWKSVAIKASAGDRSGTTWKLAETADFVAGVLPPPRPDAGPPDSGEDASDTTRDLRVDAAGGDAPRPADAAAGGDRPGDAGEDDAGCSCRAAPGGGELATLALLILPGIRARRRSCAG